MTLASIVLAGTVTIGGFWGEQYEKLTAKWLPHCIHEMEKGEWTLPLPAQTVTAIPEVKACAGLVANQRGTVVCSWEGKDFGTKVANHARLNAGGESRVWVPPVRGKVREGRVALHTWFTSAEFKDIVVTGADGKVLWSGLPDPAACERDPGGNWTVDGGVLRQTNAKSTDTALRFGDETWGDYAFRCKARKLGGAEGFILHVRERGRGQAIWANLGGWGNRSHGIESRGDFDFRTPLKTDCVSFENGRWYDLEVTVAGDAVTVKVDGKAVFDRIAVPEIDPNAPTEITVDTGKARFPTAPDLWGIFFEDIDLSLDGGVYAEMVRNRSFEDGHGHVRELTLEYWDSVGNAECVLDKSRPISEKNRHSVRVSGGAGAGIANQGYFGYGVRKGTGYNLSVALRGDVKGPVEVSLEAYSKPPLAVGTIPAVTADWRTYGLVLTPNDDDPQARLVFRMKGGGELFMDCVSMFPADAVAGIFRKDLVEKLKALKPSFMRFPGGCWVEGNTMKEAYRWKKTIGSIWERETVWNIWKYWSTNGVGFHEYLLLAEALGAKPLYCINVGMSHRETVPMDRMGEFVQDALDCIEYANGPVTSKWGALRAAAGHPAPFNLRYLEIGNENGGRAYEARYALMAKAVRAKYPDVKLVFDKWGSTKRVDDPKDLRDDHFYSSPDVFMGSLSREYDVRKGDFGIFVGEYAVTSGTLRYGSLRAAIGEAAFMLSLERNQDQVRLAAYAPLFANAQHTTWMPNLIYPTTTGCFTHPSWNVQRLFSENRGDEVLGIDVKTGLLTSGKQVIRKVQASAVRDADGAVTVKLVNCTEEPQSVKLNLTGRARKTLFTGPGRDAHNSPSEPEALKEQVSEVDFDGTETLPPLSLTVYRFAHDQRAGR